MENADTTRLFLWKTQTQRTYSYEKRGRILGKSDKAAPGRFVRFFESSEANAPWQFACYSRTPSKKEQTSSSTQVTSEVMTCEKRMGRSSSSARGFGT